MSVVQGCSCTHSPMIQSKKRMFHLPGLDEGYVKTSAKITLNMGTRSLHTTPMKCLNDPQRNTEVYVQNGVGKGCHCQGMPLPRDATIKGCHCQGMPLSRDATVKGCHCQGMPLSRDATAKGCHCQEMPLSRDATVKGCHCQGMPLSRDATAKGCHCQGMSLSRDATAKGCHYQVVMHSALEVLLSVPGILPRNVWHACCSKLCQLQKKENVVSLSIIHEVNGKQ